MKPIKLGDLRFENPIIPSPLAGYTDSGFRVLMKKYGASLVFTEMISSGAAVHNPEGTKNYTKRRKSEGIVGYQIVGTDPEEMVEAAKFCQTCGADLIDVNMGCTDHNITKTGAGASLLNDFDNATSVVENVVRSTNLPVTCKIRIPPAGNDALLTFGRMLQDAGAGWITLHGRTPETRFGSQADWGAIRLLKEELDIPVIGNGDVWSADDAKKMFDETGCDGVMIGRALMGSPWLPGNIYRQMNGEKTVEIDRKQLLDAIFYHAEMKLEDKGERMTALEMRRSFSKYLKGWGVSQEVWNDAHRVSNYRDILSIIDRLEKDLA